MEKRNTEYKGWWLTPFPLIRAIYMTIHDVKQAYDYEKVGEPIFKKAKKCWRCGKITITYRASWLPFYWDLHPKRFLDTWNYCKSTRHGISYWWKYE